MLQLRTAAEELETAFFMQAGQQQAGGTPTADRARPVIMASLASQEGQQLTAMWAAVRGRQGSAVLTGHHLHTDLCTQGGPASPPALPV